jgi:hypothetical protein
MKKTQMKTRSLSLFTFCLVVLTLAGQAQIGKTTFGLRAGINFQNINGDDYSGKDLDNKMKAGFHIGANAEVPIAKDFYIQPGVLFSTKGARHDNLVGGNDLKVNLSYIEIPVNLLYKPEFGPGKLLLGFGPYIAFGVGGKRTLGDDDQDIEWDKEIDGIQALTLKYYKRTDAGANFIAGYELNSRISAQINAQLGLVKINPEIRNDNNDESSYKNTGFGISIGYRF